MNENELRAYCAKELPKLGMMVAHVMQSTGPGEHTTRGFPDLVLIAHGHVNLWELKSPEDRYAKLNPAQQAFHHNALLRGYFVPVIHSVDDALLFYDRQIVRERRCPRCGYSTMR